MDSREGMAGPPPFLLPAWLLVPPALAVLGGVAALLIVQVPLLPRLLGVGGPLYTALALAVALTLRLRARRPRPEEPQDRAASGRSAAQRVSLAAAVCLLLLWLITVVADSLGAAPILLATGGPVVVGAAVSIAANARLVFSPRAARAEVATVASRAPGHRRILALWVLAPLSWIAYAAPGQVWTSFAGL
jgi:hypothetical protein